MDETSIDEFFDVEPEDYQSDEPMEESTAEPESTDTPPDEAQEGEGSAEAGENSGGADEPQNEENPAEATQEPRTYVLRVNHEDKTVTQEELMNYAQMGVDYSRVKTQLEQAKNDNTGLQSQIADMQRVVDVVNDLAKASNIPVDDLLKSFRKTRYTSLGYSDKEAELAVERDDLTKERDSLRGNEALAAKEESGEDRAKREVAEFQQKYPDVSLSEELVKKLLPDCQNGMSISSAYAKMKENEKDQRIAELERQLAAEKQNSANRESSPGSLRDSGKKVKTDPYDDFFDAF